jgi:hypothetical protein
MPMLSIAVFRMMDNLEIVPEIDAPSLLLVMN